jgi:signal peptidase I
MHPIGLGKLSREREVPRIMAGQNHKVMHRCVIGVVLFSGGTRPGNVKRIAGEPGDRLRLSNGQLFINDKLVILSNALGKIVYNMPPHTQQSSLNTNVTVPDDCYFLLGDNATNSLDSRFWRSIPRENIVGRVLFCYWPPERVGRVK